ncbi:amine oxidase [Hymenopellis radicata]|nr:amine oxidase [Hymenopellis radicata]
MFPRASHSLSLFGLLVVVSIRLNQLFADAAPLTSGDNATPNTTVLILGGGVAGVIAARTLHRRGIDSFIIVEARDELGGRMQSHKLGGENGYTIEKGANWIQGPGAAQDEKNFTTYDENGFIDYSDVVKRASDKYDMLSAAGVDRFEESLIDLNSRTGYALINSKPRNRYEDVAEYFQFDLEFAQRPEATSWVAQSMNDNFTYSTSTLTEDGDLLAIDQRGFKALIQEEARDFLKPDQLMLNSLVTDVAYSDGGVTVTLQSGEVLTSDYALCTFSVGVLQYGDIAFKPKLPYYKEEAIQSMVMATYTKIFFKFKEKFWFDTEMGVYADPERGRYPIWQSLDHPLFLPGSGIIFVTVTGDYSLRVEALPEAQVKEEALGVLRNMFPAVSIGEPEDFFYYKWHSDSLFRGSYSNWPASFLPAHHMNLRANLGRLYFGGEATSLRYFGFLHGAYHEGHDMATLISDCVDAGGICEHLKRVPKFSADASAHSFQEVLQMQ